MSQTLNLPNYPSKNLLQLTQLSNGITAAANSLPVVNAAGFTSGFLLVGAPGSDQAELLPNTGIDSGTSIAVTSQTVLPHTIGDPVYALFGSQLRVWRAADDGSGQLPADTAFAPIGPPIPIKPDGADTVYTDPTGGGKFWYKVTYYNPTTGLETDLGSAEGVRGLFTVNYCSLDAIRQEAGFRYATYVSDDQIEEKRQAAQDEINGALDEFYETPLQPPINSYLRQICIRLAAGLLRKAQYSQVSDPQVNGQAMYDDAQKDLTKLIMKERVLVDKQGKAMDTPGASGGVEGWPNATTDSAPASSGGAPRVFRMSDIQGTPGRGNMFYGRKW